MSSFIIFTLFFCHFIFAISSVNVLFRRKPKIRTFPEPSAQDQLELAQIPFPTDEEFIQFMLLLPPIDGANHPPKKDLMIAANLGIMHLMKKKWNCDTVKWNYIKDKEFGLPEHQKKCENYGVILDKIYEYFFRVFVEGQCINRKSLIDELPKNEQPNFANPTDDIHNVLLKLSKISHFYFNPLENQRYSFGVVGEELSPLTNADNLKEWNNEKSKKTKLSKILSEQRTKFGQMLEGMAKKAKELADDYDWREKEQILRWDIEKWLYYPDDYEITKFVNNLPPIGQEYVADDKLRNELRAAYLGAMYLLKKNWDCEKIDKKFQIDEKNECTKFENFVNIIYEYFYRQYVKSKHRELLTAAGNLPGIVKPNLKVYSSGRELTAHISEVILKMNELSKFYFNKKESAKYEYKLEKTRKYEEPISLTNAHDFNVTKIDDQKECEECEHKLFEEMVKKRDERVHFDKMLEQMAKKLKALAKDENWNKKKPILMGNWFLKNMSV